MDIVKKEQKAWDEVEKRINFFVEAFNGKDVALIKAGGKKVIKSMEDHAPLYAERIEAEFDPFK